MANAFDQFDQGNSFDQFDQDPDEVRSQLRDPRETLLLGAPEVAAQVATSAIATPVAGLAGIIQGIIPGGKTGPEAVENVLEKFTFQPRSEHGKRLGEAVSKPFEKIEDFADTAGEVTGDPDDVLGATAVKTAILGAPALLGFKKGRGMASEVEVTQMAQKLKKQQPPTVDELFKKGTEAFKKVEQSGVKIKKDSLEGFSRRLEAGLADAGIDPVLHPKAHRALERIKIDTQGGLSFKQLETLRRIASDAGKSLEASDRRFGRIIVDQIDDYVAQLNRSQTTGGNPQTAVTAIKEARSLWSRAKKGEELEGLVDRAGIRAGQFSGSGFENALRTEFRGLALNQKRFRRFSAAEQAAIRRVAEGGPIANGLRFIGKFAPRGVISTAISAGGGAAIGGPLGAIILPTLAEAGRRAATNVTKNSAVRAAEIARAGEQ